MEDISLLFIHTAASTTYLGFLSAIEPTFRIVHLEASGGTRELRPRCSVVPMRDGEFFLDDRKIVRGNLLWQLNSVEVCVIRLVVAFRRPTQTADSSWLRR